MAAAVPVTLSSACEAIDGRVSSTHSYKPSSVAGFGGWKVGFGARGVVAVISVGGVWLPGLGIASGVERRGMTGAGSGSAGRAAIAAAAAARAGLGDSGALVWRRGLLQAGVRAPRPPACA